MLRPRQVSKEHKGICHLKHRGSWSLKMAALPAGKWGESALVGHQARSKRRGVELRLSRKNEKWASHLDSEMSYSHTLGHRVRKGILSELDNL